RPPAAIGLTRVEAAVGPKDQPVNAALEAAPEGETRPLIAAVDLLQGHAHDHRPGLIADETLAGEGAELAARRIPPRLAGGLPHAGVREPDAGRRQRRHAADPIFPLLAVVEHAARVLVGDLVGEARLADPAQAGRVAVVFAFADVVHLARRHPFALVIDV